MITFTKPITAPEIPFTETQSRALSSTASKVLINATAGSGKSQLLQQIAFNNPKASILYLAFNKQIVKSIQSKLPVNCTASTFHAFGLQIIRNNQPNFRVDFHKYTKMSSQKVANLVQKHMSIGGGQAEQSWLNTCNRFHLDKNLIPAAMKTSLLANAQEDIVSGSDMLCLPVRKNYKAPAYDIVLCDEVQDCGVDKIQLLTTINAERLIMVGDTEYQQINSFSGSDPEIFNLLNTAFRPEIHTINETFRCPKAIIAEARTINNNFHGLKPGGLISYKSIYEVDFSDNSLILCRANAPLLKAAQQLIAQKKRFTIKKTVITKISAKIKKMTQETTNITDLKEICEETKYREMKRYKQNKWNPYIPKYEYEAIAAALDVGKSLNDTKAFLKTLSDNTLSKSNRILSTIHSAKGMQSPNVFYLEPTIGKSIALNTNDPLQRKEESNIDFVALTRSQNNLTYVHIKE